MQKFYKIYHYSPHNLVEINPKHYGTGVARTAECKRGKVGLDKSYFYLIDQPEDCVRSHANRYEIYMPYDWKQLIYDIGTDDCFFQTVKEELKSQDEYPYHWRIWEIVEKRLQDHGYKGFMNSMDPQLPHVVALFYSLTTRKPTGPYIAYNWQGIEIERSMTFSSSIFSKFEPQDSKVELRDPNQYGRGPG